MERLTRDRIRFLLGDEPREFVPTDPTMTVLDYLRLVEKRNGTKEGCNEGDCGACTVVVVRPKDGQLTFRAINSCIQFVGSLDGCQLLTVENLKTAAGELDAVQQAMVDCHGSQCGFCTPGFVMSLHAMLRSHDSCPSEQHIDDALAGNLCRCTGYAPIVRAAQRAFTLRGRRDDGAEQRRTLERLEALDDGCHIVAAQNGRSFSAPGSVDELAAILEREPGATVVAGSTDVGLWVTKQFRQLSHLVWLGRVRELARIRETAGAIEIGAAVTYTDALDVLAAHYPDLGELLRRLGSLPIRNAGTLGGNVANGSPIGDGSPALIALGATLHLRKGTQERAMPIEDFFLAYGKQDRAAGEFVTRITVPKPDEGGRFRAYKVSKRFDQDISAVMGAFSLQVEDGRVADVRIAFGGMAATPKRAPAAEGALRGKPWVQASLSAVQDALAADFTPLTDMRASASYRMTVARNMLQRLLVETSEPGVETRLVGHGDLSHA